jgi:hypothetical protein
LIENMLIHNWLERSFSFISYTFVFAIAAVGPFVTPLECYVQKISQGKKKKKRIKFCRDNDTFCVDCAVFLTENLIKIQISAWVGKGVETDVWQAWVSY